MSLSRLALLCSACGAVAYVLPASMPVAERPTCAAAAIRMEEGIPTMPLMMPKQKSWMPKAEDRAKANKKWYIVDADGLRLGRMSSEIAKILLGKHKPTFTPGADVGDMVIVVNAEKVTVTGNKRYDKFYRRHSGRPGGMKIETFDELQQRIPERIVEKAVKGMLPKNSHGRELFRHLKVYKGGEHPHDAQTPEPLTFSGRVGQTDKRVMTYPEPTSEPVFDSDSL